MTEKTLQSLIADKARLEEELRQLDEQERDLVKGEAEDAYAKAIELLKNYGSHFSAKQKNDFSNFFATESKPKQRPASTVAPKYWLPHNQETWTGRGKMPKAFAAWVGTAAYTDWKKNHPNEKFPKFPG